MAVLQPVPRGLQILDCFVDSHAKIGIPSGATHHVTLHERDLINPPSTLVIAQVFLYSQNANHLSTELAPNIDI